MALTSTWPTSLILLSLLGISCSSTPNEAPLAQSDLIPEKNLSRQVEVTFRPEPRNFSINSGILNQSEILSQSGIAIAGVLLEGQFTSGGWALYFQDHPVQIEENGHFKAFIPIRPPGNQFLYSASGPGNRVESGSLLIRVLEE